MGATSLERAMKVSDFDYYLPPELIAQTPVEPRDHSRLMVLHRSSNSIEHGYFYEVANYLSEGDILVFNDSRVIPARLLGRRGDGSRIEILLLRRMGEGVWEALARPGKKVRVGVKVEIKAESGGEGSVVIAEVLAQGEGGIRTVRFSSEKLLESLGKIPLPPYIKAPLTEAERYQTVYARVKGSVAAPTAGLHFTRELLKALEQKGVRFAFVTLHIGLDSFRPVRAEDPESHPIHQEYGEVTPEVAHQLSQAKKEGRRVVVVGTSTARLLEAAARAGDGSEMHPFAGWVSLFILPGYRFRLVDALITNFHLPRSTLLMLVSAFASREFILQAYEQAKRLSYRFYSFGDAMLVL